MTVTICIGSSCHEKGARAVAARLRELSAENRLQTKLQLAGSFCDGNCQEGVAVTIEDCDEIFSVTPDTADAFFRDEVRPRLDGRA